MHKTVLINPYGMSRYGKIRYLNIFPLGLGYLMSALKIKGFNVEILDCDIDNLHPNSVDFTKRLIELNPDVVGITYWSFNRKFVIETLSTVKKVLKDVETVVGGPHPSVIGEKCVENPVIDYAFHGEAEVGVPLFLKSLENKNSFRDIPGLIYHEGDKVLSNPPAYYEDLDSFGHVDYETLQLRKYHKRGYLYGLGKKLSAPIQATRGCPYQCQFCSASKINGVKIRAVSVEHLMFDIQKLYKDFDVRLINLVDDNFTFHRGYALEVCEAIENSNLKGLTLASPNGVHLEKIDSKLLEAMHRAGWTNLLIAPETGSEKTLNRMKKRINLSEIPEKVKMIKDTGILVSGSFIIGYPGETLDDINATSDFIQKCDFDVISVNKFQPLPGTPIFDELIESGEINSSFIPVDTMGPSKYAPKGMTCTELDRLHKMIYLKFFLNSPRKALNNFQMAGLFRAFKRLRWLFT